MFYFYVGGRYGHQTSNLFTITNIEIHHRQTKKGGKPRHRKTTLYMEIYRSGEKTKQHKPRKHAYKKGHETTYMYTQK